MRLRAAIWSACIYLKFYRAPAEASCFLLRVSPRARHFPDFNTFENRSLEIAETLFSMDFLCSMYEIANPANCEIIIAQSRTDTQLSEGEVGGGNGMRSQLIRLLRPITNNRPRLKQQFVQLDSTVVRWQHSLAASLPSLIRPQPRLLTVAITARCNLRCLGCRYERDFMLGQQLPIGIVLDLLDDAREAGFEKVRLYGGEPLLHRDLARMVDRASKLGLNPYITTNGLLLGDKIEELYNSGLRSLTIGYYGRNKGYDAYVQRAGSFDRLERSIAAVRDRYGMGVAMQMNFLLSKPSARLEELQAAWAFALRYNLRFQVDLVHYSLPYFSEGVDRELQFSPCDRPLLESITSALADMKRSRPDLYPESIQSIYSIADWAIKGEEMQVPCTAYRLVWVGADGTVQLCYVTFKLGNLHKQRLRELLFTVDHYRACRKAFELNCPHCHCERDDRIRADSVSYRLYTQLVNQDRRSQPGRRPEL